MILVRVVFHSKPGAINQLVDMFKRVTANTPENPTILTDLSGTMNTMVMEGRHASLAAYEQWRADMFKSPEFQATASEMTGLMESGSTEFYTIEQG